MDLGDFCRIPAAELTVTDLKALDVVSSDVAALERKLLEILCLKELPGELQDAATELLDALPPKEEAVVETMHFSPCAAMRRWFQGAFGLRDEGLMHPEPLTVKVHHCKKQEKLRRPIATSIYPSAQLLTQLLLSCPELVKGKEVLELGAGFHGLPSMAAACRAPRVWCTELEAVALQQLEINLKGVKEIEVQKLDWCNPPSDWPKFEVLLGSDVVHDTWMAPAVLRMLRHFAASGARALLVMPARYHRYGVEEFQQLLTSESEGTGGTQRLSARWFPFPEDLLQHCDAEGLSYDCYIIDLMPMAGSKEI